jgi:peroxiredoxin
VADEDRALADAYDARSVLLSLFGRVRRLTYVISKHGEIAGIFEGELNASAHVDGVRAVVARLEPEAREAAPEADAAAVTSAGAHPNG